jgi:hypothetical protein
MTAAPYHHGMRMLLFILMLTLLPLRGWMGDAMATGMAVAELQASVSAKNVDGAMHSVAGSAINVGTESTFHSKNTLSPPDAPIAAASDCAGHMGAEDSAAADMDHCTPCSACGACHSASMSAIALPWGASLHGAVLTARPDDAFFSADAASGQKPPIS